MEKFILLDELNEMAANAIKDLHSGKISLGDPISVIPEDAYNFSLEIVPALRRKINSPLPGEIVFEIQRNGARKSNLAKFESKKRTDILPLSADKAFEISKANGARSRAEYELQDSNLAKDSIKKISIEIEAAAKKGFTRCDITFHLNKLNYSTQKKIIMYFIGMGYNEAFEAFKAFKPIDPIKIEPIILDWIR